MLTGPLLLVTYRENKAYPCKLDRSTANSRLCEMILQLFSESIGKKRSEIEEELKSYQTHVKNPKIVQGLSKILFHNSAFSQQADIDPVSLRKKLFSAAAKYWKTVGGANESSHDHKRKILQKSGNPETDAYEQTEVWMFGDLSGNQILKETPKFTKEELIDRFNIEQVQGLLLNAIDLRLSIQKKQKASFRQLMQMLKFFRLMYRVKMEDENWLTLVVDGPGSVLENSKSYAVELANFFPAIVLLDIQWSLRTVLKIKGKSMEQVLELDQTCGYKSHYPEKGVWYHNRIQTIVEHFNQKYQNDFIASPTLEIVNLQNNRYLLPDFIVSSINKKNKQTDMKIEWIRYMSIEKKNWLMEIKNQIPKNYVFAFKGKTSQYQQILKELGENILCFNNQLTAPAILKKFHEKRGIER